MAGRSSASPYPQEPAVAAPGGEIRGSPYRWTMLALIWCCYCAFGLLSSSTAPLVSLIMGDLRLGATEMGFVLGTWQLVYIAVAFWCGAIMDRIGVRRAIAAGMVFLALSATLRAFAVDFFSLAVAVGLFGVGGPMVSVGSPKLVALWFSGRQRGAAIGVSNTGPAIGSVLILATASSVLAPLTGGWRGAVLVPGLVIVVMLVLWLTLAREAPGRAETPPRAAGGPNPLQTMRELMGVNAVRVLMLGAAATFAVNHGLSNWLPRMLEAKSLTPAEAGLYASLSTLAGIASTLLVPRLVRPGSRRRLLTGVFAGQCLTILSFAALHGHAVVGALPLLGFFQAAINPLVLLILMDTPEVGSRHMGTIGGLYFALAEIGGFAGPFAVGILYDLTGSFLSSLLALAALAVGLTGLSLRLRDSRQAVAATCGGGV